MELLFFTYLFNKKIVHSVTSETLQSNLIDKCTWIWIKLDIKIKHREKIMECEFEKKMHVKLFFFYFSPF